MTVAELIEALRALPPDKPVVMEQGDGSSEPIGRVEEDRKEIWLLVNPPDDEP